MSTMRKVVLGVIALAVIVAMGSYGIGLYVLRQREARIVTREAELRISRVHSMTGSDLAALASITKDWAVWNETYRLTGGELGSYAEDNLSSASLRALRLCIVAVYDDNGALVLGASLKNDVVVHVKDENAEFVALWEAAKAATSPLRGGLAEIAGQVVLVATHPVLPTHGLGPSRGHLVMAQVVDDARLALYGLVAGGEVKLHPPDEQTLVTRRAGNVITAAGRLEMLGQPAWGLSVTGSSDALELGGVLFAALPWIVAMAVGGYVTLSWLVLRTIVADPVRQLTGIMQDVAMKAKFQVAASGGDEIQDMVNQSREVLNKLGEYYALFEAMSEGVAVRELMLDSEGRAYDYKFIYVNPSYEKMSGYRREDVVDRPFTEVIGGPDDDWPTQYIDVAMTGVPQQFLRTHQGRAYQVMVCRPSHLRFATVFSDITDLVRAEDNLRISQHNLQGLMESIDEMVFVVNQEGIILHANPAAAKKLGYHDSDIVGQHIRLIHDDSDALALEDHLGSVLEGRTPERPQPLKTKDGRVIPVETLLSTGQWSGDEVVFAVARDISDRVEAAQRLWNLSMRDELTGAYNRTFFVAEMDRMELSKCYPTSIISIDVNDLKLVNDVFGHPTGDQYLRDVVELVHGVLRKSDLLARVGGDELMAVLPGAAHTDAEVVVARLRNAVAAHSGLGWLPMSVSLGVATADGVGVTLSEACVIADKFMYSDKMRQKATKHGDTPPDLTQRMREIDFYDASALRDIETVLLTLAAELGLSPDQSRNLTLLLHYQDIGMVTIPAEIAFKKGRLTRDEQEEIRLHPEKGFRIALAYAALSPIAELILKHHAWYDGGGYPLQLKGEGIPLECRVLAVVDSYYAMIADRPYRQSMSPSQAMAEVERGAGTQFDPLVVRAFQRVLGDGQLSHKNEGGGV